MEEWGDYFERSRADLEKREELREVGGSEKGSLSTRLIRGFHGVGRSARKHKMDLEAVGNQDTRTRNSWWRFQGSQEGFTMPS